VPTAADPNPFPLRDFAVILSTLVAVAMLGARAPDVALDGPPADLVVRITDTASWGQMPWLSAAVLVMIVSRPGIAGRRRWTEGISLAVVMALVLAGNGVLNEDVVKPLFGVPRPNIEAWAESGQLGSDIADADTFYARGSKDERRLLLEERLPEASNLGVTDLVRAHWVHEAGYSFPSGHSTTATAFATVLVGIGLTWLTGWRRTVATVIVPVWAGAVILTRIVLDVHTTVDVVAGTVAGLIWGSVAYLAIRWLVARFDGQMSQSSV
jgi:phosphatidylglycerophosphatase B